MQHSGGARSEEKRGDNSSGRVETFLHICAAYIYALLKASDEDIITVFVVRHA